TTAIARRRPRATERKARKRKEAACGRLFPGSVAVQPIRSSVAGLLGLFLLLAQLALEIVIVLVDEFLQLALALLDVGLLHGRAVEGRREPRQRHRDRVLLVLE